MKIKNEILHVLNYSKIHFENKEIIMNLLKNNDLKFFYNKINFSNQTKVINADMYGKLYLNGVEQFLVNLDAFISFYSEKLFPSQIYSYNLCSIFLKSEYSKILLSNKFLYSGGEVQKNYYCVFKKMMTERFLKNLLLMRYYVYPYINHTNVNLDCMDYSDDSYDIANELFVALFHTNRSDVINIIAYILYDIRKNIKKFYDSNFIDVLGIFWKDIFINFQHKGYYVTKLFDFKIIKFSSKYNSDSVVYKTLNYIKSFSKKGLQILFIDKIGNVIFESNNIYAYLFSKNLYFDHNKIINRKISRYYTITKLCFSDGSFLKQKTFVYPLYIPEFVGACLFIVPDNFSNFDFKYIEDSFKYSERINYGIES